LTIDTIVTELKAERDRINHAITALEGMSSNEAAPAAVTKQAKATAPKRRGGITAAGRKRISEMMKRRWAERRQKAKSKG